MPPDLHEIDAIKRLKYRYCRCLDEKCWDEMADCLTGDATSAYSDGQYAFTGRDAIMQFLRDALGAPNLITVHRVHQPEIELLGPTTATGIWALDDLVIETTSNVVIRGAAFYSDEYAKLDGHWKIKHTGYRRIFEEMFRRSDTPSWRLTANRWAAPQEG